MQYTGTIKHPNPKQIIAMQKLNSIGYDFIAVSGRIILERYGKIIKISKDVFAYKNCQLQRYVIAEKLYNYLKTNNKL